jgi:hypothetical protein
VYDELESIWKEVIDRSLIDVAPLPQGSFRDWGTLVMTVGAPADIRTQHIPNTSQTLYRFVQFGGWNVVGGSGLIYGTVPVFIWGEGGKSKR